MTKPVFRVAQNQIIQQLGISKLKNQFWHTHPSQLQGMEELAFGDAYVPMELERQGRMILYSPISR